MPDQPHPTAPQRHPMQVVTRRTGLSPAVLRMWERRYGVVRPTRTAKGRRLYSDEDVERLRLLARVTHGGRTIGQVAALSLDDLTELVRLDVAQERARVPSDSGMPAQRIVADGLAHIERLEAAPFEHLLRRALLALPATSFLDDVVVPILHETGDRWRKGAFRPVHGQLAAVVLRRVLDGFIGVPARAGAPEVITATPAGQHHELGALLAAAAAAVEGWAVTFLGANLPAVDIADAVRTTGAPVLALSIVYPSGDLGLAQELRTLGAQLPRATVWLVGGAAAGDYASVLEEIGAEALGDLESLRSRLRAMG